jgi:hypothetical protein
VEMNWTAPAVPLVKLEPSVPDSASLVTMPATGESARATTADVKTAAHTSRCKKLPQENFGSFEFELTLFRAICSLVGNSFNYKPINANGLIQSRT